MGLFNAIIRCNTMVCIWPIPVVLCVISHLSFLPIQGKTVLHNPKCLQNHYYGWMISWCSTQSRGLYFQNFIFTTISRIPRGTWPKTTIFYVSGVFLKMGVFISQPVKSGCGGVHYFDSFCGKGITKTFVDSSGIGYYPRVVAEPYGGFWSSLPPSSPSPGLSLPQKEIRPKHNGGVI